MEVPEVVSVEINPSDIVAVGTIEATETSVETVVAHVDCTDVVGVGVTEATPMVSSVPADIKLPLLPTPPTGCINAETVINYLTRALENYYTKEEIARILAEFSSIRFLRVEKLPEFGSSNIIYLVPHPQSAINYYDEYIWYDNKWEIIGTTKIDLSDYPTFDDLHDATGNLETRISELMTETQRHLADVRKELADDKAELEGKYEENKQLIESTQGEVREASAKVDELEGTINATVQYVNGISQELGRVVVDVDAATASITELLTWQSLKEAQITEIERVASAQEQRISDTITTLNTATGNITELRQEMDGINETITTEILKQVNDDNSQITLAIGQRIDAKNETIKTAIEKEVYGEDYTEVKTIGQILDGKKDEITSYVLASDSFGTTVGSLITQNLTSINLRVQGLENYAGIILNVDPDDSSKVTIKADVIELDGKAIAKVLEAGKATIGDLTLTNATVSGNITATSGSIGNWTISEGSLVSGNVTINSNGSLINKEGDVTHWALNSDGSGSLANSSISWTKEGVLSFSGNAIVVDDHGVEQSSLTQLISNISNILSWFELDEANNAIKVKSRRGFYSESFVSALGIGGIHGGGGGGGGASVLTDLNDIAPDVAEASNGDVLVKGNDGKWHAESGNFDKNYIHRQGVASAVWVIQHNLGKFPSVTVMDSANTVVEGEVVYDSVDPLNKLTIKFSAEFSGIASLN